MCFKYYKFDFDISVTRYLYVWDEAKYNPLNNNGEAKKN